MTLQDFSAIGIGVAAAAYLARRTLKRLSGRGCGCSGAGCSSKLASNPRTLPTPGSKANLPVIAAETLPAHRIA